MKNNKLLYLIVIALFLIACASVEESDFFEPQKSNSYLLDAYQGETHFSLESRFDINTTNINNINFSSFDGNATATIHAIYIGDVSVITNRKIIVYCHDKSGNIDTYWPRIKLLANMGLDEFGILALDYRGYGRSTGSPKEESIYADTNAALRWLSDQGVIDSQVTIYGYGLGAAAAIQLAAHPRSLSPSKIILEAPFASIESLLQNDLLQSVPAAYFTKLSFNNVSTIKSVSQPLLWLHGTNDKVYDLKSQGQLVYNAHTGTTDINKFNYKVVQASHYNIPEKFENGFDGYLVALLSFLQNN